MAVSVQEYGLKGERKFKEILLIHSNCTKLKKCITQLLNWYLVFIRAKTKRPRTWCHDVIKTVINISIVITSFQLESILTLAEVTYLPSITIQIIEFFCSIPFYFFMGWQWKPARCMHRPLHFTYFYASHRNAVLKRVPCSHLKLASCRASLFLCLSVLGYSRGIK